jgi:hypothetical protein
LRRLEDETPETRPLRVRAVGLTISVLVLSAISAVDNGVVWATMGVNTRHEPPAAEVPPATLVAPKFCDRTVSVALVISCGARLNVIVPVVAVLLPVTVVKLTPPSVE